MITTDDGCEFAPVWPTRSGDPISDRDPIAAIEAMKAKPGKDIVQYGFGQLDGVTQLDSGIVILSCQVR